MERLKETDIAVIEFNYGGSDWMPWAYIGPDRKFECSHPAMIDGIAAVRIRYLDDRDEGAEGDDEC